MRHTRLYRVLVSGVLCLSVLAVSACGMVGGAAFPQLGNQGGGQVEVEMDQGEPSGGGEATETAEAPDEQPSGTASGLVNQKRTNDRPTLLRVNALNVDLGEIRAAIPAYTYELSQVINLEDMYLSDTQQERLTKDGFYVGGSVGGEFFEIYEWNRYVQTPSFITVDAMMHTYHLYFAHLQKMTEKNGLSDKLLVMTEKMLADSLSMYEALTAAEGDAQQKEGWLTAAERNIAFLAVARVLLDPSYDPAAEKLPAASLNIASEELDYILAADGIHESPLLGEGLMEDYSQYKPRGYYDGDEQLERYFRAMMWYGRINFNEQEETLDRSALLLTLAAYGEAYQEWADIYAVTSFFTGGSDDNGICEYAPLIEEAYGKGKESITAADLLGDADSFMEFHMMTAELPPPAINSIPTWDDGQGTDEKAENAGFRLMGQRFSIDAVIFEHLIYDQVDADPAGNKRMLPDALDVPAAFGSDQALSILDKEIGATGFAHYAENMENLRKGLEQSDEGLWSASLYSGWLNTLRPLLEEKGDGYLPFMQSDLWQRKDLESFLGSFTELKHDTILYSKQVMAEMGGGDMEILDDRGYVEPEPLVFARFQALADGTAEGLKDMGLLPAAAEEDLRRLSSLAESLRNIALKELRDELPTEEEFEIIRSFGGELEHFWHEVNQENAEEEYFSSSMFPAALVVDVATDPNGSVLQLGNGNPSELVCLISVDGKLKVAKGAVFNFYQFEYPMSERLTDKEWRVMMGIDMDENGEDHFENTVDKPAWTMPYRLEPDYEY